MYVSGIQIRYKAIEIIQRLVWEGPSLLRRIKMPTPLPVSFEILCFPRSGTVPFNQKPFKKK